MRYILILIILIHPTMLFAEDEAEPGWSFQGIIGAERSAAYTGSDVYVSGPTLGFTATYTATNDVQWIIGTGGFGVGYAFPNDWAVLATLEYEPGRATMRTTRS